jgi:hypothetical protein
MIERHLSLTKMRSTARAIDRGHEGRSEGSSKQSGLLWLLLAYKYDRQNGFISPIGDSIFWKRRGSVFVIPRKSTAY